MEKQWKGIDSGGGILTANGTTLLGGLGISRSSTILRCVSGFTAGIGNVAPVAEDEADLTIGLGIISSDAFALGSTAVPDPEDEPDFAWLFWKHYSFWFPTTTQDPSSQSSSVRESFDIRSMRKIRPRETLAWMIQYADVAGTPVLHFNVESTRVLVAT